MKKLIAILLMLALAIPLTANLTFADGGDISDAERNEIIETAKKGWYIYETVGGMADDATDPDRKKKSTAYIDDFVDVDAPLYGSLERPYGYQLKTLFKTKEELKKYIDNYFIDNIYDGEGYSYSRKKVNIFDDYVYLSTTFALATWSIEWDFEDSEIEFEKDTATVILKLTEEHVIGESDKNHSRTVDLVKVDGNWKICGGSLFYGDLYSGLDGDDGFRNKYYIPFYSPTPPATGENTVLYLVVACAAVVAMTAVVVRWKREVVA